MKNSQLEQLAVTALETCLQEIPFMQVKRLEQTGFIDGKTPCFSARLKLPTGEQSLFVEAKSSGQPRLAREAVNLLWRAIAEKGSAYGVFMAPYISPTSAEICAAEGIGYLDLAGNCRLFFGQVYIHKEGKPNPFSQKRELRSLYAPKSERMGASSTLSIPQNMEGTSVGWRSKC